MADALVSLELGRNFGAFLGCRYGGENCRAAARIADVVLMAREGLWPGGLPRRTREFASLVAAAKGVE